MPVPTAKGKSPFLSLSRVGQFGPWLAWAALHLSLSPLSKALLMGSWESKGRREGMLPDVMARLHLHIANCICSPLPDGLKAILALGYPVHQ